MATPKKKTAASSAKSTPKAADPFKVRKNTTPAKSDDIVTPSPEVAEAIDAFRQAIDQAKFFEGEATTYKNTIVEFAQQNYVKRFMDGHKTGFKLQGSDAVIMYIVQDSSAGFSDEDVAEFADRWGEEAAEELIVRDFASIRFNDKTLEAHYDEVVAALQKLPADILDNLFKPMLMKARPNALENARKYAKNAKDLQSLMRDLKLKNYIK